MSVDPPAVSAGHDGKVGLLPRLTEHPSVMGMYSVLPLHQDIRRLVYAGSAKREPRRLEGGGISNGTTGIMKKLGTSVAILAGILCWPVGAQTINVATLDQAGAQMVLKAAKKSAQQLNAPSAIAVVDPAGDLLAFQRMNGVRPASADLAIEKARTAARLQRPTAEIEDNINQGRTAFVTAGIAALRGGMPIRVNGEVVGAVGIAGLSKDTDTGVANTAAAALSSSSKIAQRK